MVRSPRHLGDSLVALTERLPKADVHQIWGDDDLHPAEAAVATPFLRRMRALLVLLDPGASVGSVEARRALRQAAPMTHMQHVPSDQAEADLLWTAVRHDLLRCAEFEDGQAAPWSATARLERGPQAHLVTGHPLAAVVEPWIDEMMRDPVADLDCDPRLSGPWTGVPFMIVQLLAHAGDVDLTGVAGALGREAGPLTRGARLPWPLENTAVGLVIGLCVEFGVAEWHGDLRELGRARCTPLGLLAQAALRAHVEGELPQAWAAEAARQAAPRGAIQHGGG